MICFCWEGFPQYAARCVGALVRATTEKVVVVATRPKVPIEGMERVAGCPVVWIDEDEGRGLCEIVGEVPRKLFVSGWGMPVFNRFRDEVRSAGGLVVAMLDNNFSPKGAKPFCREVLKAVKFRLLLRGKYDGFFVPGRSGRKLLRFYGVKDELIAEGLYAADESLFSNGKPLPEREKKIVYVGQFCARKNILRLVEAFRLAKGLERGWRLELYGCGPLRESIPEGDSAIIVHAFAQPEQLAEIYRSARAFVLPSVEEHWGLVVHEAALSGCVLCLSNRVGAADDLFDESNGVLFDPYDTRGMADALARVMGFSDDELLRAQGASLKLAGRIGLESFVAGVRKLKACGRTPMSVAKCAIIREQNLEDRHGR